ncbi:unnamed protein product [Eruca vesicaria subsp. sativa]|uniref:DUF7903 domain-containing protein n=1 Tax=Eruca vesicaria subsp. sativa TaxID=29727 RepID=A0ABC8M1C0_ERUVS|nr:unnamed protein product [Eruca vesicaria subsp. sativa]
MMMDTVFESCHVKATVYRNQTLRLRVRETDRFSERIGTGEVKREVILMLKDMNSKLQTLTDVLFWKCSEMFLEPCGISCIVKPFLHDKERYDVDGAVEFLTPF